MEIRVHGRRARARWSAAGVLAVVMLVGACEGSNLFEGEVSEDPPRLTVLSVPQTVDAGGPLTVAVSGTAPRGVDFIEVRFAGAAVDTVTVPFDGLNTSVSGSASTSVDGAGTQVVVTAFVVDVNGSTSQVESETVTVIPTTPGPPN